MDATHEFRTELLENLAEQGELPQRKPKINLDSDPVKPVGDTAPAVRQTSPSGNGRHVQSRRQG